VVDRGHEVSVVARTCDVPGADGVRFHRVRGPARPFLLAYPWFMVAGGLSLRRHRRGAVISTGTVVPNRVEAVAVHCCHQAYTAISGRPQRLFRIYGKTIALVKRVSERWYVRRNAQARFVCVSDGVADEIRRFFPAAAGRVMTIHNGVDTAAFAPGVRVQQAQALRARLAIGEDRLVLAFVASEWEHKGLRTVLEAIAEAPAWDLLVAGRGRVGDYQAVLAATGIAGRVHWLGVVEDVQSVYGASDAFVLASHYETFSLVTFEAAASGLPLLATDVNGVRELLDGGRGGAPITLGPAMIAARLRELGADAGLRAQLGASARRATERFSWERMVDSYEQLLNDVITPATADPPRSSRPVAAGPHGRTDRAPQP
jgi:glycosyltransferase involved in cell wall biosynthesis